MKQRKKITGNRGNNTVQHYNGIPKADAPKETLYPMISRLPIETMALLTATAKRLKTSKQSICLAAIQDKLISLKNTKPLQL